MSTFYGQVRGQAETTATRRGSERSGLRVSAQSWDGSVILAFGSIDGETMVSVEIGEGSTFYGNTFFYGTIEQLKEKLKGGEKK